MTRNLKFGKSSVGFINFFEILFGFRERPVISSGLVLDSEDISWIFPKIFGQIIRRSK